MRKGNPEALKAAAQRKSVAARARADAGIRSLIKSRTPITFENVAATAQVSKDFLYRTPELRARILSLRARTAPTAAKKAMDVPTTDSQSSVIRTLSAKLTEERARHRAEVAELQRALERAHGELLQLRREGPTIVQSSSAGPG